MIAIYLSGKSQFEQDFFFSKIQHEVFVYESDLNESDVELEKEDRVGGCIINEFYCIKFKDNNSAKIESHCHKIEVLNYSTFQEIPNLINYIIKDKIDKVVIIPSGTILDYKYWLLDLSELFFSKHLGDIIEHLFNKFEPFGIVGISNIINNDFYIHAIKNHYFNGEDDFVLRNKNNTVNGLMLFKSNNLIGALNNESESLCFYDYMNRFTKNRSINHYDKKQSCIIYPTDIYKYFFSHNVNDPEIKAKLKDLTLLMDKSRSYYLPF